MKKQRIVILSDEDVLDEKRVASMGMRQLDLAKDLAEKHSVTLATTYGKAIRRKRGKTKLIGGIRNFDFISGNFDVAMIELSSTPFSVACRFIASSIKLPLIVDSYYAMVFEKLVSISDSKNELGQKILAEKLHIMSKILTQADHFIVATPRQRDYMLGFISPLGKINLENFTKSNTSIIPNFVDVSFSKKRTKRLRGKLVEQDDKVIIWLGGVYPWFDPLPIIRAMPKINRKVKKAKLLIIGGKNPSTGFGHVYQAAEEEAKKLNLYQNQVIFVDWVPKEQSFAYCAESDLFVILSKPTLEDEFAYRTRTLTALLLGIPAITNGQDYLSELITAHSAGAVCQTSQSAEIAKVILSILSDKSQQTQMSKNTKRLLSQIRKDTNSQPLFKFLQNPSQVKAVSPNLFDLLKLQLRIWLRR